MSNTTTEKFDIISNIADRAIPLIGNFQAEKFSLFMDFDCANELFNIDLQAWLEADDANFMHDVFGIYNNLNRETKQMENCFTPRFAR